MIRMFALSLLWNALSEEKKLTKSVKNLKKKCDTGMAKMVPTPSAHSKLSFVDPVSLVNL